MTSMQVDDSLLIKSNDMNDIPIETHIVFDILLVLIIFLSLLFNILISNVYYRNDHIITHQGVLVISLIVSNLLWTIGIFPFSLAAGLVQDPEEKSLSQGLWIFQDPVCGIVGFGNAFVPLGKLFTVILMLGERAVAILLEPHYKKIMNKWVFAALVFLAWFLALLCGLIPPALGFYSDISPGKGTCFPPLNVYAALVFYIIFLVGGTAIILLISKKRERELDTDPLPLPPTAPTYSASVQTVGVGRKQLRASQGKVVIDYERGKFETISPASNSSGIVIKSPLKRELTSDPKANKPDKDLVDYDLHTGKSKMSKEYNGVLALFALYAIVYLPFAVCSVVLVPVGLDNVVTLLLYSTTWLDPLLLLISRVLLRRAIDRMCFEVCCVELQCCVSRRK